MRFYENDWDGSNTDTQTQSVYLSKMCKFCHGRMDIEI